MKTKKKQNPENEAKTRILSKFTTGRTKSHNKRKRTLLLEYKFRNKANKFTDRRIGEKNRAMTVEDRMVARFAAERAKRHRKKTMYNLGDDDDDILTHRGRSVQDIEKFEDPRSDEEEDDTGKLDANYVSEAHFGGGLFTKVSSEESKHHNIIDQLIADSKKRKAEQQLTKERTLELTDKLDKEFKDLLPMVSKHHGRTTEEEERVPKKAMESYDVLFNELKYEAVGKPSERLKTDLEIEIEEKRKLEKLEKERLERMKRKLEDNTSDTEENEKKRFPEKHLSADDLDDGLELDIDDEAEEDTDTESDESDEEVSGDDEDEEEINEQESEENKTNINKMMDVSDDKTNDGASAKRYKSLLKPNTDTGVADHLNSFLTYENLKQQLEGCAVEHQVDIIRELIRKNHPAAGCSKENLENLFSLVLQHVDDTAQAQNNVDCWILLGKLAPDLFDITHISSDEVASCLLEKIKEKKETFASSRFSIPMDVIVLLKLVPLLFPTSDFVHPVATPATVLLCHILSHVPVTNSQADVSRLLFCVTLALEFTELSNRYCPEALNSLRKVLTLANLRTPSNFLMLSKDCTNVDISEDSLKFSCKDLVYEDKNVTDTFCVKTLYIVMKLLLTLAKRTEHLSSAPMIWSQILKDLDILDIENYPLIVKTTYEDLRAKVVALCGKELTYLTEKKKKPKALRLYEPNIRQVIDGKSFRIVSQAKQEHDKLLRKYKKELKGAVKEIRKDRNFLANVKLREQARRDAERTAKVKQIYSWGQTQQSELNKMLRKNRHRRK